jgi:hypothetical protein
LWYVIRFSRIFLFLKCPKDQPWSAQDERQLIGRIWRQPQSKQVKIIHLLAIDTTDIVLHSQAQGKAFMLDLFLDRPESTSEIIMQYNITYSQSHPESKGMLKVAQGCDVSLSQDKDQDDLEDTTESAVMQSLLKGQRKFIGEPTAELGLTPSTTPFPLEIPNSSPPASITASAPSEAHPQIHPFPALDFDDHTNSSLLGPNQLIDREGSLPRPPTSIPLVTPDDSVHSASGRPRPKPRYHQIDPTIAQLKSTRQLDSSNSGAAFSIEQQGTPESLSEVNA